VQGPAGLEAGQNAHDVISNLGFQIFD